MGALVALAGLLAAMVLTAPSADAHARLEGSSPQDGATLAAVPPEVMLRFNEPIQEGLNQVSVKSGSTEVAKGDPQVDGSNVYQPIEFTMEPGDYTVTYKVVSADGHPVSGSFDFTYAPPEGDGKVEGDPGATGDSPEEDSSATEEPSETAGEEPSESAGEDASEEPSETSSATSEPTPSETTSGSTETPQDDGSTASEETAQDSTSPWWWALAVGALVVVGGGLMLLARGRRDSEDIDDDEFPRD